MVEGVTDREIRDAIEELKRSTASIEKQTEALRLQQNAMGALVKSEQRTVHARAHSDQEQLRRWEAERGQISREVSAFLLLEVFTGLIFAGGRIVPESGISNFGSRTAI